MKILFITDTTSGCYKVRSKVPAKYLERIGHKVQILSKVEQVKEIEKPDVVVFFRGYPTAIDELVRFFKAMKIKVVYDSDDALDLVRENNPSYAAVKESIQSIYYLVKNADVITTTTDTLAQYFRKFNKNVSVLPNCVDLEEWQERNGSQKLRIGFSGSSSHITDLLIVVDVIRDLQKKYDFDFVIQGFTPLKSLEEWYEHNLEASGQMFKNHQIGRELKILTDKLKNIRYEFHPFIDTDKHHEKLRELNLDIGLCPLEKNDFNKYKSCIKFYEYAMVGTVSLASNVFPYSNEVNYLAKNNYWDWKEKLEKLITDKELRNKLLREQRKWVLENRDISQKVEMWQKLYECRENK